MEITGRIKVINPTQDVRGSFKKRELVVTTEEQYPQHIMIEFTQAKVDDLNNYQIGDSVKVSINLRGREWINPQGEAKYFNSIQAWRIERIGQATQSNPVSRPESAVDNYMNNKGAFNQEEEDDDLPF